MAAQGRRLRQEELVIALPTPLRCAAASRRSAEADGGMQTAQSRSQQFLGGYTFEHSKAGPADTAGAAAYSSPRTSADSRTISAPSGA